jgi:hypothetical protein
VDDPASKVPPAGGPPAATEDHPGLDVDEIVERLDRTYPSADPIERVCRIRLVGAAGTLDAHD